MTSRRIALAIALCFAPISMAGPLLAQQPTKEQRDEASQRFRRGIELYKEGDYRAALVEFKRAYELAPNFAVLYNIGYVYYQLQDYANALPAFESYLAQGGGQVPQDRRAEVEKEIEKLRTRVAKLDVSTNVPDVEVSIDDIPVGKTPFAKPIVVNPGMHKIVGTKEGRVTATKTIEVASFDSARVQLDLAELTGPVATTEPTTTPTTTAPTSTPSGSAAPPLPPPPPPEKPVTWPGWAVTAALAVGGGITGGLALSASGDLQKMRDDKTSGTVTKAALEDQASKAKTMALVSDILIGSAIVAGGVTLIFTLKGPSAPEAAPAAEAPKTGGIQSLRLGVSPTGAQLMGTF